MNFYQHDLSIVLERKIDRDGKFKEIATKIEEHKHIT